MPFRIAGILSLTILLSLGTAVFAFSGPSSAPGIGGGAIRYNSDSGSVGVGILPLGGSQSSLMVAATGSRIYGLEVQRADGSLILRTEDKDVTIATVSKNATTTMNGNLVVTGTITGNLNVTLPAENVVSGVFGKNTGGGATPPYAFPGSLGVGTSSQAGLPQTLSVYGSGYIKDTASIGTSAAPGFGVALGLGGAITVPSGYVPNAYGYPTYSFANDPDTGMYRVASDVLGFTTNATDTLRMRFVQTSQTSQVFLPSPGVEAYPSLLVGTNFPGGGGGGGFYAPAAGILSFVTGGIDGPIERMRLVSSTGLGLQTKTPAYTLDINGHMRLMPTSTVPAVNDGVIYFNASAGKFKCYEGGWKDCIGGVSGSGALGQVAFFTGTSAISADSNLYWDNNLKYLGVGAANPQSLLEVGSGGYFQFSKTTTGAPSAADCNADAERGRLVIDTSNNLLYVCNGLARGWDYIPLTDN